jgi:hypothetical protein
VPGAVSAPNEADSSAVQQLDAELNAAMKLLPKNINSPAAEWKAVVAAIAAIRDKAEAPFLRCLQALRTPAWTEFTPPSPSDNDPGRPAWESRFMATANEASGRCEQQEARSAAASCKIPPEKGERCRSYHNVLAGRIMIGDTICDAIRCVTKK